MITLTLPIRLVNLSNERSHWSKKAKRAKEQRGLVALALRAKAKSTPLPIHVCITRIGPRFLDSHDNLPISAKHVADSIAEVYGIPDNSPLISFEYAQQKGAYGVLIQIESHAMADALMAARERKT